jgi:hypothetical protein
MEHLIINAIILIVGIILWKGNREIQKNIRPEKPEYGDWLRRLHLITEKSESEIFKIAAKENGISTGSAEYHFKSYLQDGRMPSYLKKFLDEGKEYIVKADVNDWSNLL